nr:transporter substrate-binding domain-containing protein [Liquorilactobacillus satsumensis]
MKKHHYGLWIIGVVVLLLIIGGGFFLTKGQAAQSAATTKTIKIATAGTIFPNAYKQNNKLTGYDVEVANAAAKTQGYTVKYVTTDFDGIFGQLDAGRVDTIANDIGATAQRKEKYLFSTPYNNETTNIAVRKNASYQQLKDLEGKTVATSGAGNNFITSLQKYDPKINIKVFETRDQAIQALKTGRVEGLLYSRGTLSAIAKYQHLDWRVVKGGDAASALVAFPFKNSQEGKKTQEIFNRGLKKIKSNGQLDKISTKYFGYAITNVISKSGGQ